MSVCVLQRLRRQMKVKMERLTLMSVLCFLSFYFTDVKAEQLTISPYVYSGRANPSWKIAKPVDARKAAHFERLVSLLMKLPKPPASKVFASGYNGFVIKHVLDSGETHSIEVAKCSDPILETALLETAPTDIDPKILSPRAGKEIQNMIDTCSSQKTTV